MSTGRTRSASKSRRSRSPKRASKKGGASKTKKVVDYSPPLVVESYQVPKKGGKSFSVRVVRDDLLPGGTKQRGLVPLLSSIPEKEAVMPAANSGYGQVALAIAAGMLGKKATVFVAARAKESETTKLARRCGAHVVGVRPGYMTVRKKRAEEYTQRKNATRARSTRLFPLGVDSPEFEEALLKELREAIPKGFRKPTRVWVAVGSGLLMRVLGKLWPEAMLLGVQVGMKQTAVEILGSQRAKKSKLFVEDTLAFDKVTKDLPPYPTVANYDAKLWKFIKQYGREGDLVWNVAGPADR